MPEQGVNFTPDAARRISNVVREVEGQSRPEPVLQRHRAGGLGRSTLWEVTAVQTGPGTVTIKRVSNIGFDLNDLSEKEDILYDPDNEPSEGDRGLLIRLGEGDLFFFKREAGQIVLRYQVSDWAQIHQTAPDVNDNQPALVIVAKNDLTPDEWRGLFKWDGAPIDLSAYSGITFRDALTFTPFPFFPKVFFGSAGPGTFFVAYAISTITADFDPTTVTWNTAPATTVIRRFVLQSGTGPITRPGAGNTSINFHTPLADDDRWITSDEFSVGWDGSYGYMVSIQSLARTGFTSIDGQFSMDASEGAPLVTDLVLTELP